MRSDEGSQPIRQRHGLLGRPAVEPTPQQSCRARIAGSDIVGLRMPLEPRDRAANAIVASHQFRSLIAVRDDHELQTVLLAELDLRLQPTLGLLEAYENETRKSI